MQQLTRDPATALPAALMSAEERPISFTRDFQPMLSKAPFRDSGQSSAQRAEMPESGNSRA